MIKGKNITLTFKTESGEELKMRASDFQVDSEPDIDLVRVATIEEVQQQHVNALNRQPRGTCVKPDCGKERAAWQVSGGMAVGSAFCPEHQPRIDV